MAAAAATVTALARYVSATITDPYVLECAEEAEAMVARVVPVPVAPAPAIVPAPVVARAVLECGAELFHRRQSRNGIAGMGADDFAPMRIARDPMKAAMPYLLPYLGPAIA